MSELVIIASDLYFPAPTAHGIASHWPLPGLDRLARRGTRRVLPGDWRSWLAASLGQELASIAPATIAVWADPALARTATTAASLSLAEPLHLTASLRSLHLPHHGRLRLNPSIQEALCAAFASVFARSGHILMPLPGGRFILASSQASGAASTTEPARLLGASLADALPRGEGAVQLRGLGSEIEMWLHDLPLNRERARLGQPTISTLWLWGAGPPLPSPPSTASSAPLAVDIRAAPSALIGDDPYVAGLAKWKGLPWQTLPASLPEPAGQRTVIVVEVFAEAAAREDAPREALIRFDREWLSPGLAAVERGAASRATLIANDRLISFTARHRLRFWRPRRSALEALA